MTAAAAEPAAVIAAARRKARLVGDTPVMVLLSFGARDGAGCLVIRQLERRWRPWSRVEDAAWDGPGRGRRDTGFVMDDLCVKGHFGNQR